MLPKQLAEKKINLVKQDPFFVSPQGEGKYMGVLTSWIRSSGCNLFCCWYDNNKITYCDTSYSSFDAKNSRYIITAEQVYQTALNTNASHIAITGGEPTFQKSLIELVDYFEDAGKKVTIETNGTKFFESKATLVSLSPKLSTSGKGLMSPYCNIELKDKLHKIHENTRYNLQVLKKFIEFYNKDNIQFKFVINTISDVKEVIEKYIDPLKIDPTCIWFMPQGISSEQIQFKAEWVVEEAKKIGANYSDRLHIRIWGDKIGV